MNRELIISVTTTEMTIALCEDKVLVELNKEQTQNGFAVGDIYLGKVRKIMPGLNAAFVNIGHERDAFIHCLDMGGHFPSLKKLVSSYQPGKKGLKLEAMKLEEAINTKDSDGADCQGGDLDQGPASYIRHIVGGAQRGIGSVYTEDIPLSEDTFERREKAS